MNNLQSSDYTLIKIMRLTQLSGFHKKNGGKKKLKCILYNLLKSARSCMELLYKRCCFNKKHWLLLFLKSFLMPWIDTEFMLFRPRKSPSLSSNFELSPSVILRLLAFSGSVSPSPPRIYSYIFESDLDVIKINYWLCMHEVFIRKLLSKKFTDAGTAQIKVI